MLKRKKSQNLATISLAIMGVGFVVTLPYQDSLWGIILQGGFEAGLVGGLADWFAVTALFRHPLGIPIPHTALLPKNRKRITATIISMLENDWLTKESIREKIADIHITEKLLTILEKEKNSFHIKGIVISTIQKVISSFDVTKLASLIERELKSKIQLLEINTYLPMLVDQITARKYEEKTLDFVLDEVDEWASKESTKNRLGGMAIDAIENIKMDGFMQFALKSFSSIVNEEKLGNIIQSLIQKTINSYRDPLNQNRQTLLWSIESKLQAIKNDEKIILELENWKSQLIEKWQPEETITDFLYNLKQKAVDFVQEPRFFDEYILPFVTTSLSNLRQDVSRMGSIEDWIRNHLYHFIETNHSKIGHLVGENLDKLDDKTLIEMLENNVGKDLQWIRVNGAICGFLIGLILVGIRAFF